MPIMASTILKIMKVMIAAKAMVDHQHQTLNPKLMSVPEKQTIRAGRIDSFFREESCGDCPDSSTDAMDAESIQRIIIAEFAFNDGNGQCSRR